MTRQRRELRLAQQEWNKLREHVSALHKQLRQLDDHQGKLNLQLARVAGVDTTANNKLVGLIEATRAEMRKIVENEKLAKDQIGKTRANVNKREAIYAESIMAIRADFDRLNKAIAGSIKRKEVGIAFGVMHRNFQTPKSPDPSEILSALGMRIQKIEREVFSETIPLHVQSGSLYVDVNVGDKTAKRFWIVVLR